MRAEVEEGKEQKEGKILASRYVALSDVETEVSARALPAGTVEVLDDEAGSEAPATAGCCANSGSVAALASATDI
jgi:hypothetical protein